MENEDQPQADASRSLSLSNRNKRKRPTGGQASRGSRGARGPRAKVEVLIPTDPARMRTHSLLLDSVFVPDDGALQHDQDPESGPPQHDDGPEPGSGSKLAKKRRRKLIADVDAAKLKPLVLYENAAQLSAGQIKSRLAKRGWSLDDGDLLGEGGFGVVCKAKFLVPGSTNVASGSQNVAADRNKEILAACKIIKLAEATTAYLEVHLPRELYFLRTISHPNIVRIFGGLRLVNSIYIFMELEEAGDLWDYTARHGPIPESQSKAWMEQGVAALAYLHDEGIAHRDFKAENLLISQFGRVRLTDFGFAMPAIDRATKRPIQSFNRYYVGTDVYNAPEISTNAAYDPFKMDIWSLGVTIFITLNAMLPFDPDRAGTKVDASEVDPASSTASTSSTSIEVPEVTASQVGEPGTDEWLNGLYEDQMLRRWKWEPKVESTLSTEVKDLVTACLDPEPEQRPSMDVIRDHAWFTNDIFTL